MSRNRLGRTRTQQHTEVAKVDNPGEPAKYAAPRTSALSSVFAAAFAGRHPARPPIRPISLHCFMKPSASSICRFAERRLLKPKLRGPRPAGHDEHAPGGYRCGARNILAHGSFGVLIGEGPAMDRDTQAVLESIRLRDYAGPFLAFSWI